MTADSEYRVQFEKQENGPRRRIRHGAVTLRAVLEKRAPNGRILDKTRLGSIDVDALEYDFVSNREEFWRVTDLYLALFDIPNDAADVVCAYLAQVVKPVTECEASADYGCGGRLRETLRPDS
jgi:hypothetical protein